MTFDLSVAFDDLPEATRVRVFDVDYARLRCEDGGVIYITRFGWPHAECLMPGQWYEHQYYYNAGERLRGSTGTVYSVRTCPSNGRCIDLVVKFCRVAQDVPLLVQTTFPDDVDPADVVSAVFNSPFEEFGYLLELRARPVPAARPPLRSKRPLAIYMPPKRYALWQLGRSPARFDMHDRIMKRDQAERPNPVTLEINRDYIMLFGWVDGIDAERAAGEGLLADRELEALTRTVIDDLAVRGFRVLDNKPKHYIVRRRGGDGPLIRREGRLVYALIDFELLQRTDAYRREIAAAQTLRKWQLERDVAVVRMPPDPLQSGWQPQPASKDTPVEAIVQDASLPVTVKRGEWVGRGFVSTETFGGQFNQGVLVIDDGDVHDTPNPVEAAIEGYEIVEAPEEAIRLLLAAGYRIKGLRLA